jgi:cholesterol transport system auxiliary component
MTGVRYDFRAQVVPPRRRVGESCLPPLFVAAWKFALPPFCVAAVALLAGCSAISRPSPVRQTFLLDPPAPAAVAKPHPGALRVGTINVAAPFRGKTFVYRVGDLRFESDFYVEFLVPPGAMLTEQTARALDHAKPFARVAGPGASADAAWVLDGFATALYADQRDPAKPAAELDITYFLTPTAASQETPVWTREYRQHVAMRDATPVAYAEALNKAFGDIVADLARDLANASLPRP